ncbi:MAG: thioredoxin family protein [Williamsia sp.]|nr:thioredoxin family protein [Williamsia sp.]
MKYFLLACLLTGFLQCVCARQLHNGEPVQFSFSNQRLSKDEVLLTVKAVIQPGVKLYALDKVSEDVPYSSFLFDTAAHTLLKGTVAESGKLHEEKDSVLNSVVKYFADSVTWVQKIRVLASDSLLVKGSINYMYKEADEYKPAEKPFRFFIQPQTIEMASSGSALADKSLWWIFFSAFAGGLLALLTPCVYSMIPITVSFFTKRSKTRAQGIRNSLYYSSSIILIFTLLGFLITLIFGPAALNNLSTNWIANLVFFAVFVLFGISFLGAFEINLPSSWSSTADTRAGTSNFLGIFFMALTLVIVSFSCTGPIIGNLLVLAAKGNFYGPLVGMFGFSLALALPFALFALFPSMLNVLGKAGGWLNSVKVTLGFLELALALKFLSNADLARGWRLLDREVFLSLWIVLFVLLGIYLLGKIKFHHDDDLPKNDFGLPYTSVTRLLLAITSFAFAVYMMPGLWGAPLKGISAFVPPMGTQDFNASAATASYNTALPAANPGQTEEDRPVKYVQQMKIYEPEVVTKYGMVVYYDYDEALAAAKKLQKPLMLDFTGINCVNCRSMEAQVWSDPQVMKRLKENFVIVSLYVDVHSIDLPHNEQHYSNYLKKDIETMGDKNTDLQVSKYGANTQPYYFFLDGNEQRLAPEGYGYDSDVQKFIAHLDNVSKNYMQQKQ